MFTATSYIYLSCCRSLVIRQNYHVTPAGNGPERKLLGATAAQKATKADAAAAVKKADWGGGGGGFGGSSSFAQAQAQAQSMGGGGWGELGLVLGFTVGNG